MTEQTAESKPRTRHDAFDGKRRQLFLDALGKSGCLRDAARRAGVSHKTVYNHQASDKQFARQCELALDMAGTAVELAAWERGVVGVEEPIVYRDEIVGTRLKRSDAILRLLLQGAKRKKYGPNPGFGRRRLHKLERKRIEQDLRAEQAAARRRTSEEADRILRKRLAAIRAGIDKKRLAEGWTQVGENWVPPGWVFAGTPSGSRNEPQRAPERAPERVGAAAARRTRQGG